MKIAIVGGTGTLGRQVAEELRARGHEIRVLSRNAPRYRVDLATGDGLDEALDGCEVVVDASNNNSKDAAATLVEGTRRLLAAGQAAGVTHHVCVSMVGCELVPMGYCQVKAAQEDVVSRAAVPWTIVRATQFHEYVASMMDAAARHRAVPVPKALLQPVACAEVARVVADVAERGPLRGRTEIGGPEVASLRELAGTWRRAAGKHPALVPLPLPGRLGQALRRGALTTSQPDVRGGLTFTAWAERTLAGQPAATGRAEEARPAEEAGRAEGALG